MSRSIYDSPDSRHSTPQRDRSSSNISFSPFPTPPSTGRYRNPSQRLSMSATNEVVDEDLRQIGERPGSFLGLDLGYESPSEGRGQRTRRSPASSSLASNQDQDRFRDSRGSSGTSQQPFRFPSRNYGTSQPSSPLSISKGKPKPKSIRRLNLSANPSRPGSIYGSIGNESDEHLPRPSTSSFLARRQLGGTSREGSIVQKTSTSEWFSTLTHKRTRTYDSDVQHLFQPDDEDEVQDDRRYSFPQPPEANASGDDSTRDGESAGIEVNGVRVWYSQYDTIDWLHDQIKGSARHSRIRSQARRSWRGKVLQAWDRSMGWVVVSLVGVVTAMIAYLVIKIESALFHLKSGTCTTAPFSLRTPEDCPDGGWKGWDEISWDWLAWTRGIWGNKGGLLSIYFTVAMAFAVLSSVLTVYMTASTRFEDHPEGTFAPRAKKALGKSTEQTPLITEHSVVPKPANKTLYFASGSGIPEVKTILSGFIIRGYLGGSTLFVKSFGLALSVASGMSLGKEGPFVHIACCVGNIVSRCFAKYELNEGKKREILSAACAAGVSVAFGAPVGGTLFSWEESSTYYPAKVMWRSFFCAAVAALTLRALDPYGNGKLVLLEVTYERDYHSNFIYIIAVLLGIFGGVYGGLWSMANVYWTKHVRAKTWMKTHPILEVAMVSAITTLISFPSEWTRIGGVEWVSSLFSECEPGSNLCYEPGEGFQSVLRTITWGFLVRAGLACITFGIKLPAGIFVPSLAAGAAAGRVVGISFQYLVHLFPNSRFLPHEDHIVPGVYALIGAAATLAGVTRTTISLVVIVIELTGTLDYVVPVAIAVLAAKVCSDAILAEGIYDLVIGLNQFPYLDVKKEHHFGSHNLHDVIDTHLPHLLISDRHTVSSLRGKLLQIVSLGYRDGCLPCLKYQESSRSMSVVGVLAVNELQHAINELGDEPEAVCNLMPNAVEHHAETSTYSYSDIAYENPYDLSLFIDQAPFIVLVTSPLELVSELFNKVGTKVVMVVDDHGRFEGVILKKGWLKFLQEIEDE